MCADLIWGNKAFHILLPGMSMKKYSGDISLMVSFSQTFYKVTAIQCQVSLSI